MDITQRQSEVVNELLLGKSNEEIANSLNISIHTVKFHLTKIYKAYGVTSRAKLARKFYNKRLL